MIFGTVPVREAEGVILAHAMVLPDGKLPKGHRLLKADIDRLVGEGITDVIGVRLSADDLTEDEAAGRLASGFSAVGVEQGPASTGRVNFHAATNGVFQVDAAHVNAFNRVDPAITLATLRDRQAVRTGDLVATLKIIPLAAAARSVDAAAAVVVNHDVFKVAAYRPRPVTLIATTLPSLRASVMDKTRRITETRLSAAGCRINWEHRVAHTTAAVADALQWAVLQAPASLIIVFGASAVCDEGDVIPEAIRQAGGTVERVGLPVDPGNLLVLGRLGQSHVIGAPGCARSPKENGFDWILARLLTGEEPTSDDLAGLGVGGLLMEIPTRPQPRMATPEPPARPRLAALILAAGKASRMGGQHKLLAEFDGLPLIRRVALSAIEAGMDAVSVVTGHRADEIEGALQGLPVTIDHNPDFARGMASSLVTGMQSSAVADAQGVAVILADMPGIDADGLSRLRAAFDASNGGAIVRATSGGKRGNPVILPQSTFESLLALKGDIGARAVIETSELEIIDVDLGPAAHLDVDTPDAVIAAGGVLKD